MQVSPRFCVHHGQVREFLQSLPVTEQPASSVTTLYTHPALVDFVEETLSFDTALLVEKQTTEFTALKRTCDQWLKKCTKAAQDIAGYLEGKKKHDLKEE